MAKQKTKNQKRKVIYQQNREAAISLNHAAETEEAEKISGPVITIKFKYLATAAYLYMVVPILIFFVSWLRWYIGFPMAAILTYGLYILLKTDYFNNNAIILLPQKHIILIALTFLIWVWLSGQGGFFYQTGDNHWRNAIFRDLINYSWPVIYPKTRNALVYYLMYWIVPALFGKLLGWTVANIVLLIWTFLGIYFTYLFIVYLLKTSTPIKLWIICFIFMTWSGLNLPGIVLSNVLNICNHPIASIGLSSAEGWLDFSRNGYDCSYLYRSNLDFLEQVYNQTILPWLATVLVLQNKHVRNFAFIGLCILPYAPLPFIGLLPIFLVFAIPWFIKLFKSKNFKQIAFEIFSIPNISAIITIFVAMLLYFGCNVAYETGAGGNKFGLFVPPQAFDWPRIGTLILFYTMEFGIYCMLIHSQYRKNALYWVIIIVLILIPNFKVGTIRDFCMNASLSALFILMIFVIKYIFASYQKQIEFKKALCLATLLIMLSVGALSPIFDILGKTKTMIQTRQFPIAADEIKTFSDKKIGDSLPGIGDLGLGNFLCPNPETKAFYKYLARK